MANNELQDYGQRLEESGQTVAYPGNCQEDEATPCPSVQSNPDISLTDAAQTPNPKNAQVLPKISPSVLAETMDGVSQHFAQLSELTRVWSMLPDDIRNGIMAMVKAIVP